MSDYITVVAVDNGADNVAQHMPNGTEPHTDDQSSDSQFITVLSINDQPTAKPANFAKLHAKHEAPPAEAAPGEARMGTEEVLVYRLPGERLGFGLKFQGGTRNAEHIQKLFIQSCAPDSPASRAATSWGHLREGDEIVEIDGTPVTRLTRLECVKCLKESNLAIHLLVRNGEGKAYLVNGSHEGGSEQGVVAEKKSAGGVPPQPPPVPPRKINKRKTSAVAKAKASVGEGKSVLDNVPKQVAVIANNEKSFTPPPDAEFYINLFADEHDFKLRGSEESDDTASTISTVVDNFSLHSSSDLAHPSAASTNDKSSAVELAKVLKSFAMLEQEFAGGEPSARPERAAKLEDSLMRLQPPASFQDDSSAESKPKPAAESKPNTSTKQKSHNLPVIDMPAAQDYENVQISSKVTQRNYENVVVKQRTQKSSTASPQTPPTPKPRSTISDPKSPTSPSQIPVPRSKIPVSITKSNPISDQHSEIHDCKVATDEAPSTVRQKDSELPRLIKFMPKVVSTTPTKTEDIITKPVAINITANSHVNNNNNDIHTSNNNLVIAIDPSPKPEVFGKCIKVTSNADEERYVDSSSDEDEEKSYELNGQHTRLRSGVAGDDSSDTPTSDEDGEKLGPPGLLDGPGPSEAYFNFHWNMLPTIGEVEEEFSSLEQQSTHSIAVSTKSTVIAVPQPKSNNKPNIVHIEAKSKVPKSHTAANAADATVELTNNNAHTLDNHSTIASSATTIASSPVNDTVDKPLNEKSQLTPDPPHQPPSFTDPSDNNDCSKRRCSVTPPPGVVDVVAVAITLPNATRPIDNSVPLVSEQPPNTDAVDGLSGHTRTEQPNSAQASAMPAKNSETIESPQTATPKPPQPNNKNKQLSAEPSRISENISHPNSPTTATAANPRNSHAPSQNRPTAKPTLSKIDLEEKDDEEHHRHLVASASTKIDFEQSRVDEERVTGIPRVAVAESNYNSVDQIIAVRSVEEVTAEDSTRAEVVQRRRSPPSVGENFQNASVQQLVTTKNASVSGPLEIQDSAPIMEQSLATLPPHPVPHHHQTKSVTDLHHSHRSNNTNNVFVSPPTFSRLPPDGHEFPPNFTEPLATVDPTPAAAAEHSTTPLLKQRHVGGHSDIEPKTAMAISHQEDAPPLPKSVPPTAGPRKVYRQDLVINVDDRRHETMDTAPSHPAKSWSPAVLEDKTVRKEIMITAKNGRIATATLDRRTRSDDPFADTFRKFEAPPKKHNGTLPSWRKDEKSEKSVRDKIAMFSNESDVVDSANPSALMGSRKSLNRSTDNLLSDNYARSRSVVEPTPTSNGVALTKKAQSVECLDEKSSSSRYGSSYDYAAYMADSASGANDYSAPYMSKAYSVENLTNSSYRQESHAVSKRNPDVTVSNINIPVTYGSLPRTKPPSVARTTSFSGSTPTYEDRRRSSISNLLEQRKKSMSKLRGLIIPEKTAVGEEVSGQVIFDLPEIKSKDAQKGHSSTLPPPFPTTTSSLHSFSKREPVVPNPKHYTPAYQGMSSPQDNSYKSIFTNGGSNTLSNTTTRTTDAKAAFKKPHLIQQLIMPPVKPPRTSLITGSSRSPSESHRSFNAIDDSDSDSVFSSKISSPPGSPVVTAAPGKFALTRTLSSETNTSIASSTTSTLTSGSGSQASCSSVGSTPTIDMSRKISKSSSNDSYANRKNILALAKCRSGKDDSTQLGLRPHQQRRPYDDEDSTDGYDDDEVHRHHAPKPKQRSSLATSHKMVIQAPVSSVPVSQPINYRLVSSADNLVDMVINVASYVEVTSDTDGDSKNSDTSPLKINAKFIDEERRASFKAPAPMTSSIKPKTPPRSPIVAPKPATIVPVEENNNEMAKWVRSEVAKSKQIDDVGKSVRVPPKKLSVSENIQKFNQSSSVETPKTPAVVSVPSKMSTSPKPAKQFEPIVSKASTNSQMFQTSVSKSVPEKIIKSNGVYHERFSSLDSLASSSSSGISSSQASSLLEPSPTSQMLQSPSNEYGSFSSFGSNHSLITPADLQLIIEEADPPLKRAEAIVVVLQRDSPECSVGVTLAGGADYETKEITVHRVLTNSPAYKDGRLRKGDRILSINGLSMRGLTHRESVTVLKAPRLEVVLVITRSESMKSTDSLSKTKRATLGSLTSLNEKTSHLVAANGNTSGTLSGNDDGARRKQIYHKISQSLEMDLDAVSNEGSSIYGENKSTDGAEDSNASSLGDEVVYAIQDSKFAAPSNKPIDVSRGRLVEIFKDNCGLGLAIEGGLDSPSGHCPLMVKKVFMGGAAEKTGKVRVGDIIVAINDFNTEQVTRVQAWNYMKSLACGPVRFCLV